MEIAGYEVFAIVGFMLAAYAVIANDSIQTLGTFLASNSHRRWWVLWLYAASILVAALMFQLFIGGGDIADGKLNKLPYPEGGIQWWHVLPPLVLLFLTRFGIPVSTTFLVLTLFALSGGGATQGVMGDMLIKSAGGYVVAFLAGAVIWLAISRMWETWVGRTEHNENSHPLWSVFQWCTTAVLWWAWLLQDFANIFVYLPRTPVLDSEGNVTAMVFEPGLIIFGTVIMVAMMAYIFATRGGEIQKIVTSKTNTVDVRAATIVDLVYAILILYFKEQFRDIPMSTTWVFLGLLAGRELAISFVTKLRTRGAAAFDVGTDAFRALIGLVISVVLAFGLPWLGTGTMPAF